ncbi:hypothetical protein GCM10023211_04380 [Orbus sasakiae]|uniref:Uncharacterized protein n=1 Tax=Orbus sasakiae TaxID=1078475 RepID=A0ABP9N592_9GAMM
MSAQTAHTIQGRRPYIEINGETLTDLSRFLSIKIGDNTYISDASGNMKKVNSDGTLTVIPAGTAISLASVAAQFDSVTTIVPADMGSYNLSSIVPDDVFKDDDEDNTFTLIGNVVGEWKDKNGMSIGSELTAIPNDCLAPYTLTFTTKDSLSLSTQYGDPHTTAYDNTSAIFTIVPVSQAGICFAKPDMTYSTGQYAGPSNIWDTSNGFKLQSIIPSSYSSNFPTTGANNLYFDLDIAGVSSVLDWPSVTVGTAPNAITATMTNISATSVRVTLTGPMASSSSSGATADAPPALPARFELVGYSGSTAVVKYGFVLQKWFVNRGFNWQAAIGTNSQTTWCAGLNGSHYAIVKVKDLTNASGHFEYNNNATIPSATPASPGNYYQRRIGGGLFSEWGSMINYGGSSFYSFYYWTSEAEESGAFQFSVMSTDGEVFADSPYGSLMGICAQP